MIAVSCNLCGRDDWRVRFPATYDDAEPLAASAFRCTNPGYGTHTRIVQCRHCGLVYANPRWSETQLQDAYAAVQDEVYLAEREGRELTFARHLQSLEKWTGPAAGRSLLDVGAYIGVFVEVATAAGWDACGVEPSAWAVALAREHGLNVIEGTLATEALTGRQFEVVTLWDVVEHLADPAAELDRVHRLLAPGGWLAIHTMDIDSLVARLMGRRWPWLMEMHLYYFSQRTLAELLQCHGFEVIWSGSQGRYLRLGYLASRVRALSRPLGRLAQGMVARLSLARLAVPVNFGDLFTVYARKR